MLSKIRPFYEKVSIPFGLASLKLGLTPDFWTIFSLFSSVLAAIALAQGKFILGLIMSIIMNIADMLDGATARAGNIGSKFGTVLDHVCDRYAEFIVVTGFAIGGWISPALALFTASGIVMASYVRAKAESAGGLTNCVTGIAGRQEKLILIWLSMILFACNLIQFGQISLFLTGLISHITAFQRLMFTRHKILENVS